MNTRYTKKDLDREARRVVQAEKKAQKAASIRYSGWDLVITPGDHTCLHVRYLVNGRQIVHNVAI